MAIRRFDAPTTGTLRNDPAPATKSALDAALARAAAEREARRRPGPPVGAVTRAGIVADAGNPNELSEHARATLAMLVNETHREGTGAPWKVTPSPSVNAPPSISKAISPYYRPTPMEPGK